MALRGLGLLIGSPLGVVPALALHWNDPDSRGQRQVLRLCHLPPDVHCFHKRRVVDLDPSLADGRFDLFLRDRRRWIVSPLEGRLVNIIDALVVRRSKLFVVFDKDVRAPLSVDIEKVPALVMCLMRLHNWCIDCSSAQSSPRSGQSTERAIRKRAKRAGKIHSPVALDENGRPADLLGHGHHFTDLHRARRPLPTSKRTPMRKMMKRVKEKRLRRPTVSKRGSNFVYEHV